MLLIRKILPKTLFARAVLIVLIPVVLVQGISTYIFYDRHVQNVTQRLVSAVVSEVQVVMNVEKNTDLTPQQKNELTQMLSEQLNLNMKRENIQDLSYFPPERSLHMLMKQNYFMHILAQTIEYNIETPFVIGMPKGQENIFVQFALPNQRKIEFSFPQKRVFTSTVYIYTLWMLGSTLVFFTISLFFLRNQIRPIIKLAVVAEAFGKGRDIRFFKPRGAQEVRRAAIAFIKMKDRISDQIKQRTQMLAGVSHDLRTPLTRMQLALALMPENKAILGMKTDLVEMEHMIDSYLNFARGEGDEAPKMIKIHKLINELIEETVQRHINIKLIENHKFSMTLRYYALKRALNNLINNAHQYAHNVYISSLKQKHNALIIIEDDGPGIAVPERENVFNPFYRISKEDENAKSQESHVGLGMTIAHDIILSHGGQIKLEDSKEYGGLRVIIEIPF